MSAEIKLIEKMVCFNLNEVIDTDLTKAIKREFKDKYIDGKAEDNVTVVSNSRKNIFIASSDISNLTKAFNDISAYLKKHKVEFRSSFTLIININTKDNEPDVFDILYTIVDAKVENLENMLTFSYRMAASYQDNDYFFQFQLESKNELKIYIQSYDDNNDLCKLNDEMLQAYYNTVHLAINKAR